MHGCTFSCCHCKWLGGLHTTVVKWSPVDFGPLSGLGRMGRERWNPGGSGREEEVACGISMADARPSRTSWYSSVVSIDLRKNWHRYEETHWWSVERRGKGKGPSILIAPSIAYSLASSGVGTKTKKRIGLGCNCRCPIQSTMRGHSRDLYITQKPIGHLLIFQMWPNSLESHPPWPSSLKLQWRHTVAVGMGWEGLHLKSLTWKVQSHMLKKLSTTALEKHIDWIQITNRVVAACKLPKRCMQA